MGTKKETPQGNSDLLAMALSATKDNITKSRGGSGRTTYLDRFVKNLLDENGQPLQAKPRVQVIAEISLEIAIEQRNDEIEAGKDVEPFALTAEGDSEDDKLFAKINKKVKNQVASAVADNKNNTSVSYHPDYKDVWRVVKVGNTVALEAIPTGDDKE